MKNIIPGIALIISLVALTFVVFEDYKTNKQNQEVQDLLFTYFRVNNQLDDRTKKTYTFAYERTQSLDQQVEILRHEIIWLEAKNMELISIVENMQKEKDQEYNPLLKVLEILNNNKIGN